MGNAVLAIVESAVVPGIVVFACGWFFGTTGIIEDVHVDGINRFSLKLAIPVGIVMNFAAYELTGRDLLFVVPLLIHKVIAMIITAIPLFFIKRYTIEHYATNVLNFVYVNNIVYGFAFFVALYPTSGIPLMCLLSALPDCLFAFPYCVFFLELNRARRKKREENPDNPGLSAKESLKLVPGIIVRILTNPVVWSIVIGMIISFTKWKLPTWLKTSIDFIGKTNFGVSMFCVGLFFAVAPTYRVNWSWIKSKCCCCGKSSKPKEDHSEELLQEQGTTPRYQEDDHFGEHPQPSDNEPTHQQTTVESTYESQENEEGVENVTQRGDNVAKAEQGVPEPFSPHHTQIVAVDEPKKSKRPRPNWKMVILCLIESQVLSPALMLGVASFCKFLTVEEIHASVLIMSLPLALIAFSLAKEYQALEQEAVLLIVLQSKDEGLYDIYVISLQEVIELKVSNVGKDSKTFHTWTIKLHNAIGANYKILAEKQLFGLGLIIFLKTSLFAEVSNVQTAMVSCGIFKPIPNKGAIAISLFLRNRPMVFIGSHLTSGREKNNRRLGDYETIVNALTHGETGAGGAFRSPRLNLFDHDFVFWLGDLNYRLDTSLSRENVETLLFLEQKEQHEKMNKRRMERRANLVQKGPTPLSAKHSLLRHNPFGPKNTTTTFTEVPVSPLAQLLSYDQLTLHRLTSAAFSSFNEMRITFPPTYRYDQGTHIFDTSHKLQFPAWCDRIVFHVSDPRINSRRMNDSRRSRTQSIALNFETGPGFITTNQAVISQLQEEQFFVLTPLLYDSVPSFIRSDHRPVIGLFKLSLHPASHFDLPLVPPITPVTSAKPSKLLQIPHVFRFTYMGRLEQGEFDRYPTRQLSNEEKDDLQFLEHEKASTQKMLDRMDEQLKKQDKDIEKGEIDKKDKETTAHPEEEQTESAPSQPETENVQSSPQETTSDPAEEITTKEEPSVSDSKDRNEERTNSTASSIENPLSARKAQEDRGKLAKRTELQAKKTKLELSIAHLTQQIEDDAMSLKNEQLQIERLKSLISQTEIQKITIERDLNSLSDTPPQAPAPRRFGSSGVTTQHSISPLITSLRILTKKEDDAKKQIEKLKLKLEGGRETAQPAPKAGFGSKIMSLIARYNQNTQQEPARSEPEKSKEEIQADINMKEKELDIYRKDIEETKLKIQTQKDTKSKELEETKTTLAKLREDLTNSQKHQQDLDQSLFLSRANLDKLKNDETGLFFQIALLDQLEGDTTTSNDLPPLPPSQNTKNDTISQSDQQSPFAKQQTQPFTLLPPPTIPRRISVSGRQFDGHILQPPPIRTTRQRVSIFERDVEVDEIPKKVEDGLEDPNLAFKKVDLSASTLPTSLSLIERKKRAALLFLCPYPEWGFARGTTKSSLDLVCDGILQRRAIMEEKERLRLLEEQQ
ncbi:putative Inositol polyphosphate 5-phosphatase E [Blattamonas nauphoetae]|uniref:Inositol polyphosphate 5-phosphatase E n=1 Tax=Blattamonas nauphoetae TaxID=2049346 RepID=A0ABQ9XZP7_9EUKA|nr:putative Inositol polyphosphate 5-phosphatase E [Blattamonas nauphoetae]